MKKRIFSLVLAVLMLFTFNMCASAETAVQPRYSYTNYVKGELNISNLQAKCIGSVDGADNVTCIKMKVTLQKKQLLWWDDVTSWQYDVNDSVVSRSYNYGPVDSGTYRVHVEATVYVGTASETVSDTSSSLKVS